jgi:4-hydroxy-4-methyl-2-oxoglutarate aldolase
MTARDPLIERLSALDTCAVSDALERHGLAGAVLELRSLAAVRPVAGRAVTVQLGTSHGERPTRHLCTAAVEASGPDDVIVVANGGRVDCASWGGLLSTAASLRGVSGVVLDGALRDVPEAIDVELPVYARAPVPVTARGRVVELDWDVAITVGGVPVAPRDLVLADASGVVVIPAAVADEVLNTAEEIARRESTMAAALRDGMSVSSVMGADYETLLERGGQHV